MGAVGGQAWDEHREVVLALLARRPSTTAEIVAALRGRIAKQAVEITLRFLREEKRITRENRRAPWTSSK